MPVDYLMFPHRFQQHEAPPAKSFPGVKLERGLPKVTLPPERERSSSLQGLDLAVTRPSSKKEAVARPLSPTSIRSSTIPGLDLAVTRPSPGKKPETMQLSPTFRGLDLAVPKPSPEKKPETIQLSSTFQRPSAIQGLDLASPSPSPLKNPDGSDLSNRAVPLQKDSDPVADKCSICYEDFEKGPGISENGPTVKSPTCTHLFHEKCLNTWAAKQWENLGAHFKPQQCTCPECRSAIPLKEAAASAPEDTSSWWKNALKCLVFCTLLIAALILLAIFL